MEDALPLVCSCFIISSFASGQDAMPKELKVGDPAPDFSLPYATRDSVARDSLKLSSLVGKKNIVLAFYPADWSGGCTKSPKRTAAITTATAGTSVRST